MTVGLLAVDSAVFLVNDRVTLTRDKVGVAFLFFLINVIEKIIFPQRIII